MANLHGKTFANKALAEKIVNKHKGDEIAYEIKPDGSKFVIVDPAHAEIEAANTQVALVGPVEMLGEHATVTTDILNGAGEQIQIPAKAKDDELLTLENVAARSTPMYYITGLIGGKERWFDKKVIAIAEHQADGTWNLTMKARHLKSRKLVGLAKSVA